MPLKAGPGSEWNCEQQNPVVQVWQDVTFLWRHLRQQVPDGYTPCPALLPWGWRRWSFSSPWPSYCLCSLFPPPCCFSPCLLCPPPPHTQASLPLSQTCLPASVPSFFASFSFCLFLLILQHLGAKFLILSVSPVCCLLIPIPQAFVSKALSV